MLFVYPADGPRTYWMKDCLIPLDIAFVDASERIVNIATLPAAAGLPPEQIPRAESLGPVRCVLETEAGWLARHDVIAGDRIDVRGALAGAAPR
jgi:uncharacterized membrane protein (UPF0127 family)